MGWDGSSITLQVPEVRERERVNNNIMAAVSGSIYNKRMPALSRCNSMRRLGRTISFRQHINLRAVANIHVAEHVDHEVDDDLRTLSKLLHRCETISCSSPILSTQSCAQFFQENPIPNIDSTNHDSSPVSAANSTSESNSANEFQDSASMFPVLDASSFVNEVSDESNPPQVIVWSNAVFCDEDLAMEFTGHKISTDSPHQRPKAITPETMNGRGTDINGGIKKRPQSLSGVGGASLSRLKNIDWKSQRIMIEGLAMESTADSSAHSSSLVSNHKLDPPVDEEKLRVELEIEIERDLEQEIQRKISELTQRLEELHAIQASRFGVPQPLIVDEAESRTGGDSAEDHSFPDIKLSTGTNITVEKSCADSNKTTARLPYWQVETKSSKAKRSEASTSAIANSSKQNNIANKPCRSSTPLQPVGLRRSSASSDINRHRSTVEKSNTASTGVENPARAALSLRNSGMNTLNSKVSDMVKKGTRTMETSKQGLRSRAQSLTPAMLARPHSSNRLNYSIRRVTVDQNSFPSRKEAAENNNNEEDYEEEEEEEEQEEEEDGMQENIPVDQYSYPISNENAAAGIHFSKAKSPVIHWKRIAAEALAAERNKELLQAMLNANPAPLPPSDHTNNHNNSDTDRVPNGALSSRKKAERAETPTALRAGGGGKLPRPQKFDWVKTLRTGGVSSSPRPPSTPKNTANTANSKLRMNQINLIPQSNQDHHSKSNTAAGIPDSASPFQLISTAPNTTTIPSIITSTSNTTTAARAGAAVISGQDQSGKYGTSSKQAAKEAAVKPSSTPVRKQLARIGSFGKPGRSEVRDPDIMLQSTKPRKATAATVAISSGIQSKREGGRGGLMGTRELAARQYLLRGSGGGGLRANYGANPGPRPSSSSANHNYPRNENANHQQKPLPPYSNSNPNSNSTPRMHASAWKSNNPNPIKPFARR